MLSNELASAPKHFIPSVLEYNELLLSPQIDLASSGALHSISHAMSTATTVGQCLQERRSRLDSKSVGRLLHGKYNM